MTTTYNPDRGRRFLIAPATPNPPAGNRPTSAADAKLVPIVRMLLRSGLI